MAEKLSSASFEFSVRPGTQPRPGGGGGGGGKHFNLVVMGDFTGRASRGVTEPLTARKLLPVDCDHFERAFTQLPAKLTLNDGAAAQELTFQSLDDFHPDKLLARAASLTKLFEARRLLLSPSTAEQGKRLLEAYLGSAIGAEAGPATSGDVKRESDDQTMARLLGGTPPAQAAPAAAGSTVQQFIQKIVSPHVTPAGAPWHQSALAAADLELAKVLRATLHHPDFQALEAAWRGADFLLRRIEAVDAIGMFLLDVTAPELELSLPGDEPSAWPLVRLLRERNIKLVISNHAFGQNAENIRALGKLARLSAGIGAALVGTAHPRLAGCDSFGRHPDPDDWKTALPAEDAAAWNAARRLPEANHVALAAPRFLLRQPYGKSGDAIESFPFEELPGEPAHEHFLWGHPALLCACVIAEAIDAADGEMEEVGGGEVGDLPMHKFNDGGETAIKPYAEAWLSERAATRLAACGIMPVLSRKDYNSVQLFDLHSIAAEPARLAIR